MKKNILSTALLALLTAGLISSCNNMGGREKKGEILYDSIVVKQQIPLLHEHDTTLPFADVSVSFTYPVKFRDEVSLARLQKIFKGTFFGSMEFDDLTPEVAMDEYIGRYSERYKSLSNMYYEDKARLEGTVPAWYWYYMKTQNKVVFQDDSLLCHAVEYSDYEGGAHGSYRITYTNIDLNRLVTLTEEDLFIPDYYRPLTEKIVQALMRSYGVSEPDSLLTKGFFTIEDIVPNNNFWINREGIHYTYNQYEIAPYAMGTIDVAIPYTELEDILLYIPVARLNSR